VDPRGPDRDRLAGLARSGVDAAFENFEDGVTTITSKMGWKWTDVIHDMGMRYCDWAHQGYAFRGERPEDVARAHAEGRIALVPALESATPIENELDRIDVLFGMGVRMLGIAYSESTRSAPAVASARTPVSPSSAGGRYGT
jgi:membrane dipeptidase